MDLFWTLAICIFIFLLLGIIVVLKKGFNEIIKAMESLDERVEKIEENIKE